MSTELAIIPDSKELVRQSTDIASLCKAIVVASAVQIQGRKYVRVEGWQSIATAHGCVASARDVKRVDGGFVATGEIRRMQDGQLIATAEGFVGEDEPVWFGGEAEVWDKQERKRVKKLLPKRAEYAIRAMAQTRAISRACRGCFAHVVVLMDAGLQTTPAEEVPEGGFNDHDEAIEERQRERENAAQSVSNSGTDSGQQELVPNASGETAWNGVKVKLAESIPWKRNGKEGVWFKVTFVGAGGDERIASTFDTKLFDDANIALKTDATMDAVVRPGKKSGTWELIVLEPKDELP